MASVGRLVRLLNVGPEETGVTLAAAGPLTGDVPRQKGSGRNRDHIASPDSFVNGRPTRGTGDTPRRIA